jgi:hypothetical protein
MKVRAWLKRFARRAPDYEIITALSVEECRKRLTGRERLGRLYDGFARPLGLSGQVGSNFLLVELDTLNLSGSIEPDPDGTRIAISRSRPAPWWIDKLIIPPLAFAGFIAVTWRPGDSPAPPFACITVALGIVTLRSWRQWRRFDLRSLDADEAVQIIAKLVLASSVFGVESAAKRQPDAQVR